MNIDMDWCKASHEIVDAYEAQGGELGDTLTNLYPVAASLVANMELPYPDVVLLVSQTVNLGGEEHITLKVHLMSEHPLSGESMPEKRLLSIANGEMTFHDGDITLRQFIDESLEQANEAYMKRRAKLVKLMNVISRARLSDDDVAALGQAYAMLMGIKDAPDVSLEEVKAAVFEKVIPVNALQSILSGECNAPTGFDATAIAYTPGRNVWFIVWEDAVPVVKEGVIEQDRNAKVSVFFPSPFQAGAGTVFTFPKEKAADSVFLTMDAAAMKCAQLRGDIRVIRTRLDENNALLFYELPQKLLPEEVSKLDECYLKLCNRNGDAAAEWTAEFGLWAQMLTEENSIMLNPKYLNMEQFLNKQGVFSGKEKENVADLMRRVDELKTTAFDGERYAERFVAP